MCANNIRLQKKYNKANQDAKANIYLLNNWITVALNLNKKSCYILADINGNINCMAKRNVVSFIKQNNVKMLHKPEDLQKKINLNEYTHIMKQRSEMWLELRKQAKVTGSTMYRALRLDTLKKQKEHYEEFINKQEAPDFPKEVMEMD